MNTNLELENQSLIDYLENQSVFNDNKQIDNNFTVNKNNIPNNSNENTNNEQENSSQETKIYHDLECTINKTKNLNYILNNEDENGLSNHMFSNNELFNTFSQSSYEFSTQNSLSSNELTNTNSSSSQKITQDFSLNSTSSTQELNINNEVDLFKMSKKRKKSHAERKIKKIQSYFDLTALPSLTLSNMNQKDISFLKNYQYLTNFDIKSSLEEQIDNLTQELLTFKRDFLRKINDLKLNLTEYFEKTKH